MYYTKAMKISKTFRLSEEAVEILNKQDNATEFLEALIQDKYTRPLEVVPLQQLKELLEAWGPSSVESKPLLNRPPLENKNRDLKSPDLKTAFSPTAKRGKTDVLEDIKTLELERDEELEFNQDPLEIRRVAQKYQEEINFLWNEYHELDKEEANVGQQDS